MPWEWRPQKGGLHGYDNLHRRMRPLLLTRGPSLRRCDGRPAPLPGGATVVDQVDIYSLLAHLAGVKLEPNFGRPNTVRYLLRDPNELPDNGVAGTAPVCGEITMLLSIGVAILATLVPTYTSINVLSL